MPNSAIEERDCGSNSLLNIDNVIKYISTTPNAAKKNARSNIRYINELHTKRNGPFEYDLTALDMLSIKFSPASYSTKPTKANYLNDAPSSTLYGKFHNKRSSLYEYSAS
jgi:hypothetical protein